MHPMQLKRLLGNIPLFGRRFRFMTYGADGGDDTLFKRASTTSSDGLRPVVYGAQARHISDLSDPDENYFVLFGGNDGWMVSPHTLDQITLWRRGEYLRLPLRPETVRKEAALSITLEPR